MRVGSLFAGIGGFDLAARWMGWSTAWYSEIDPFGSAVLAHHFPEAVALGDITRVDWSAVEPVDVLCGGFPCQPASMAGLRKGQDDERWLWPEFARAIRGTRPRWVVGENVRGLLSVGGGAAFGEVLGDLARLGYDAEWGVLSAAEVGAPHERQRVWIVAWLADAEGAGRRPDTRAVCSDAYGSTERSVGGDLVDGRGEALGVADANVERPQGGHIARGVSSVGKPRGEPARSGNQVGDAASGGQGAGLQLAVRRADGGCGAVGDADEQGWRGQRRLVRLHGAAGRHTQERHGAASSDAVGWNDAVPVRGHDGTVRLIPRQAAAGGPESALWPVAHGVPGRVAQLRGIGNAIVPRCAYEIFRMIARREAEAAREAA